MTNPSSDVRRPFGAQAVPQTGTAVSARWASDVIAHVVVEVVGSDTTVIGTTSLASTTVTGSLSTARVGDAIWFTSGTLAKTLFSIVGVSGTTLTLGQLSSVAPTAGDTYDILRYRPQIVSSTGATTVDTELPAAAALADGESNATAVPEVGARMMGFNGTTWDRAQLATVEAAATYDTGINPANKGVTVNARLQQNWDSSHPDNAGAGADDLFYGQNQDPNGNVCMNVSSMRGKLLRFHNGAGTTITGTNPPPMPIGSYGSATAPTAVTSGRAVQAWLDLNGRVATLADAGAFQDGAIATLGLKADAKSTATDTTAVTIMQVLKQISASVQAPIAAASRKTFTTIKAFTATTAVTQITAADASYGYDICSITLDNISGTDSEFILYADDGTTEVWRGYAKANDMRGISFPQGRELTQGVINKQWKGKAATSVTSVYVTLHYVKSTAWAI